MSALLGILVCLKNLHSSQILLIILFTTFLVFYFYYKWKHRRYFQLGNKIKGPIALPFIGNGYMFIGKFNEITNKLFRGMNYYKEEDIYRGWLGSKLVVFINKPDYLEIVLNNPHSLHKSILIQPLKIWLEEGLLTAPVEKWKAHRKLISPTFNQKILESFASTFQKQSQILVEHLSNELGCDHFDLVPYINSATLTTICKTTMGVSVDDSETSTYIKNTQRALEIMVEKSLKCWYLPDVIFDSTTMGKELTKIMRFFDKYTNKLIKQKRAECIKNEQNNDEKNLELKSKKKPFLQLLIENTNFSDTEIREEVNTLTVTGSDSTAKAISTALFLLAMHPNIQDKVYTEILEIFGNSDRPMELSDLKELTYLDLVIKETIRLFPVPIILRDVSSDIKLDSDITLPAGCSVLIPIITVHKSEKYWLNPEKFIPERFTPEEISKRHPYTYIPFSGGPRNCVGIRYANMVMKYMIVAVLRKYKLVTSLKMEDIKTVFHITLTISPGCNVKLEFRNK